MGYAVLGSGNDSKETVGDKTRYQIKFDRPSFPGSIAIVKGQPARVSSEGVTTSLYFRGPEAEMAQPYGEQIGKTMSYFTGVFGLPPYANLTVVETEEGAPNGFAAPGMIFLAPRGIGKQANTKLLANQVSRQWFEELVSPATRNHLWLTNGLAAYSELLWSEHEKGPAAMESQLRDVMVESLTVDTVPIIQAVAPGRLLARIVGAHRRQGRHRHGHAALRHGRREFLQDPQGLHPAIRLEERRIPTISRRWPKPSPARTWGTSSSSGLNPAERPSSSWNTPSCAPPKAFA